MTNLDKACIGGMAAMGGVMGYLYTGLLAAGEIVAVSNPVGALIGAAVFAGIGLHALEEKDD